MEQFFNSPEFYPRTLSSISLEDIAPTVGCVTSLPSNIPSLTTAQLTVGHLPNVQQLPHIRDTEWLKVEVCREYQRGACQRTSEECRYAHPPQHIQVSADGKVVACFDALKGRCSRESCKYLHPTFQIKQQLEVTGRQTLLQNRAMLQQMLPLQSNAVPTFTQGSLVGYEQVAGSAQASSLQANQLYSSPMAGAGTAAYSFLQPSELTTMNPHLVPYYPITASPGHQIFSQHGHSQVAAMVPAPGSARADRLEICRDFQRGNCTRGEYECRYGHPPDRSMIDATDNTVTVCMDCIKGRCTREKCKYFHPPAHLQAKIRAAQNPAASYLPPLAPGNIAAPQTTIMMANGTALGQPPIKRHAIETSVITSAGNGIGTSHGLTSSTSTSQNMALAALYGYNNLATFPHQAVQAAPAYYQQGTFPMFQLQYGGAGGALAAAPGQTPSLNAFSLPTTTSSTPNGSTAPYTILNGQNGQLATDIGGKSTLQSPQSTYGSSTLTVCRDFQSGKCVRPFCRFIHVHKDYVEIKDDRVTLCRNAMQGKCVRSQCKFYHPPPINTSSQQKNSNTVDPVFIDSSNSRVTSSSVVGFLSNGTLPTVQPNFTSILTEGAVQ